MRKIGAHVSAAGGIHLAIPRAAEIGCNCVQIFSGSPRVWKKPSLETHQRDLLHKNQKEHGVSDVFTHALYLVNLTSDKPELLKKSLDSLCYELEFDDYIGGAGVIVHLGSHLGAGWDAVKEALVLRLTALLERTPEHSTFLIENSAGQNGKLCSDLTEIRWLLDQVKSPRLGWCFDTCHGFEAGYALSPTSAFTALGRGIAGEVIDNLKLWSSLKCIHVNDSKAPFAKGLDRHENIGDGQIPQDELQYFLGITEVRDIPLVLEVPGIDGHGPDAENVTRLKKLLL